MGDVGLVGLVGAVEGEDGGGGVAGPEIEMLDMTISHTQYCCIDGWHLEHLHKPTLLDNSNDNDNDNDHDGVQHQSL